MKLEAAIAANYSNIAGMVVRKDGETVYERYFGGCTAESRLNVFSVTKSIVSILLGIALDRGCLGIIDQQVLEFFPEYTPKRGEKPKPTAARHGKSKVSNQTRKRWRGFSLPNLPRSSRADTSRVHAVGR